ncbi:MAG: TasA family protein [Acidimicrobiia bacterium]
MLRKIRLVLCLGMLSGVVWAGTFAAFSDSGTAETTFTAGTVDLVLSGETDDAYAFTSLQNLNMKPGDVVYAPLTIANSGSLSFDYSMTTSATGTGFKDKLRVSIKEVPTTGDCAAADPEYLAGTELAAEGALSAAAISSRTLASGSQVACFKVSFPSAADDNTFQGATTTATFTFSATQSA